ncbi:MAG: hypothetical protein KatS3mg027_1766 [Bacteroidia bacterium]|nr:MAG: hypothetical protein KatS3mg027_1766 [Bacteroidia bacterium]
MNRVRWTYFQEVSVPKKFKAYLWDHIEGKAPLEKLIYRILIYGSFKDIKWLYKKYPEECFTIVNKYPDINRSVKFWIKYWHSISHA